MKLCLKCGNGFVAEEWVCPACGYQPACIDGFQAHAPEFARQNDGFRAEHFDELAKFEQRNFWFRARNELVVWALKKYNPRGCSFLEIGCGTGFVLSGVAEKLPDSDIYGSEIFVAGFFYAAKRVPRANFMQMDARKIPFSEEFDTIGAFDVLEHIREDSDVLSAMHRALKPGGALLLTVPQHRWLWSAADEYACHVRRYSACELHKKLKAAGFKIERSTSFVSFLLPMMLISRLKSRIKFDPSSELRIHATINTFLFGIMRIEMAFIRWGMSLPFGGSRLIVATK